MGTAERRLEILKYLCRQRYATMSEIAERFDVSVRTIQRDIYEIEIVFRVPLDVKCGRYGGVYVIGDYCFDRSYMCREELELLVKLKDLTGEQLSSQEHAMLAKMIQTYTPKLHKSC